MEKELFYVTVTDANGISYERFEVEVESDLINAPDDVIVEFCLRDAIIAGGF